MKEDISIVEKVVNASNIYEKTNSELKREYIKSNIILYNSIASTINDCLGTFGTGYPFYVLDKNLEGALPVINEQLRYNNELLKADTKGLEYWTCGECLSSKGNTMPDLKQICKNCPAIINELKPRKLINRLPDIDMWMLCDEERMEAVKNSLKKALDTRNMSTSDVNPINTIYDILEIAEQLQQNEMPDKKLPIDTHLIDQVTFHSLIKDIPDTLDYCKRHDEIPYLPIHPWSLRKTWQKDDSAYNFVHDYLSSLTEFELPEDIKDSLRETRKYVAERYSFDELYKFLITTGPDSVARRHETPELKESFRRRIDEWEREL